MNLSKNFTLEEMCITSTGLVNEPDFVRKDKLFHLCNFILQPIRDACGTLKITSGYRSYELNKSIGGSEISQHKSGEAADFISLEMNIDAVFDWIRKSNLQWGQLIRENKNGKDWIHISLPRLNRKNQMVMIYEHGLYRELEG